MNPIQILTGLLPGLLLGMLGLFLIRSHRRAWNAQASDETLEDFERTHFQNRYRRRTQASGLLILIGVLISVGQFAISQEQPLLFAVYWVGVLLLTFWVILLALGDAMAISAYSRNAQSRLNTQRQTLQRELDQLRAKQGNGHARTQEDSEE